jgi:hypothetical protein
VSETIPRGLRDAWVRRLVTAGARGPAVTAAYALASAVWTADGWAVPIAEVTAMTGLHRATAVRALGELRAAGALLAEARTHRGAKAPCLYRLVLDFDLELARASLGGRNAPAGPRPRSRVDTRVVSDGDGGGVQERRGGGVQERPLPSPDPDLFRILSGSSPEYSSGHPPAPRPGYPPVSPRETEDRVKSETPEPDPEQRRRTSELLARLATRKAPPNPQAPRRALSEAQIDEAARERRDRRLLAVDAAQRARLRPFDGAE